MTELKLGEALRLGIEAHRAGKLEEADRYYTAILKAQPKHPDANHNMGVLAASIGKIEEAIPFFKAAVNADPSITQYWLSIIDAFIRLNKKSDAKSFIDQARQRGHQSDAIDKLELGLSSQADELSQEQIQTLISLYNQGKHDSALSEIGRLLDNYPNAVILHNISGASQAALGQYEAAIKTYKKALELQPDNAEVHNNMGIILKKMGNFKAAVKSYKQALKIRPDYSEAHNNMGNALKDKGDVEAAIESYKKAIKLKPDYADAYYNYGATVQDQSDNVKAVDCYEKAIKFDPTHSGALNNLGNLFKTMGKVKDAISLLEQAIAIQPDFAIAHNNLGTCHMEQHDFQFAESKYKEAIRLNPGYPEAYYNLGNLFRDKQKFLDAIENYKKAISLKKNYAEAFINLGVCQFNLKDFDRAAISYKTAIRLKPDYAEAYKNLATCFKAMGKIELAVEHYNMALNLNPDLVEASHMISALSNKTTKSAPRKYVQNLFDNYAKNFEEDLTKNLKYKAPKELIDIILSNKDLGKINATLDMGCGTGLIGSLISDFCDNIVGIDVSGKMLEKASSKDVYSELHQVDILEYLQTERLNFDLFIAADVFIYCGDLFEIFKSIKERNKKYGILSFTTEHLNTTGYKLENSGRYAHSYHYIQKLAENYRYSVLHFSKGNLREENGKFIEGGFYVLAF